MGNGNLDNIISHVFTCLENLACLINEGKGRNGFVETRHGTSEDERFDFAKNDEYFKDNVQDILLNNNGGD